LNITDVLETCQASLSKPLRHTETLSRDGTLT
jgi:hypothetical protein